MAINVLYLDTLNEHMEKMIMDLCPKDVSLKFLNPVKGEKGTIEDAEVLIVTTYNCSREVIEKASKLKLIQRTGVGLDMVDVECAKERNIPISICKGFNSSSVAELAILDILALYRRIITLDNLGKKGEWHTWTYRHDSYEIFGKTVGVVGGGAIGYEIMLRLAGFGCEIIYTDICRMNEEQEKKLNCKYTTMEDLLNRSDIVTLHVPLLESTKGIIGREQFDMMKDSAVLINTARGPLVDSDALIDALKSGKLWGAAVDVFDPQDPLFGVDGLNIIITPHIGAATADNYYRSYRLCMENAQRVSRGEESLYIV